MSAFARTAVAGPAPSRVASLAHDALMLELLTAPKPGLVSQSDHGSHDDMTQETFRASARAIRPYWQALAEAGTAGATMAELRRIGLGAEAAMMAATRGVNTHRGTIFGLGLLCAAAGMRHACPADGSSLGGIVAREWGAAIAGAPVLPHSHGTEAMQRHGAGGARLEAASGFPSLYRIGLPALRAARRLPGDDDAGRRLPGGDDAGRRLPDGDEAARVHCLFALIAEVRDTNLLHRGGAEGAAFASAAARAFMAAGGIGRPGWRRDAEALHRRFVARRLSPGGCADLLAMTLFVDMADGELAG